MNRHPAFAVLIGATLIPMPEHDLGQYTACPECRAASDKALAELGEVKLGDVFDLETASGTQRMEIVKVFDDPDAYDHNHGGGYYQIRWSDGHLNGMSRRSLASGYFAKRATP